MQSLSLFLHLMWINRHHFIRKLENCYGKTVNLIEAGLSGTCKSSASVGYCLYFVTIYHLQIILNLIWICPHFEPIKTRYIKGMSRLWGSAHMRVFTTFFLCSRSLSLPSSFPLLHLIQTNHSRYNTYLLKDDVKLPHKCVNLSKLTASFISDSFNHIRRV